jgi:hypothetical protein
MNEVHSIIEFRFGNCSSDEKRERIERQAIEFGISVEKMLLIDFERVLTESWMKKDRESIFELFFIYMFHQNIARPNVSFGTYSYKGVKYPKIILHDDYLDTKDLSGRVWINDEMISRIGNEIDLYFDFEFVEGLRLKKY